MSRNAVLRMHQGDGWGGGGSTGHQAKACVAHICAVCTRASFRLPTALSMAGLLQNLRPARALRYRGVPVSLETTVEVKSSMSAVGSSTIAISPHRAAIVRSPGACAATEAARMLNHQHAH